MDKIKVLHFQLEETVGGIETFLFNLYKQVDRNLIEFQFITLAKHAAMEEEYIGLGAIVHHISANVGSIKYCKEIRKILLSGIDVVHVHKNSAANIIPIILSKQCGIKKIYIHSHNTAPSIEGFSNILHRINRHFINYYVTKKFACSSEAGRWMYLDENFEVLKNGILVEKYRYNEVIRKKKRKELFIGDDIQLVGNIGRFTAQKNQKRAIDIFDCIYKENNKSKMILIGEGELKKSLEEYVKRKNLEEHILFLGMRQDIPDLLMAVDVMIMPSRYEGFPIAAVEAQAAGTPIFLADTISRKTAITEAVCWFSLEDKNEAIAKKVNSLPKSKYDRINLNDQVIREGYDIKTTAMKLQQYYLK